MANSGDFRVLQWRSGLRRPDQRMIQKKMYVTAKTFGKQASELNEEVTVTEKKEVEREMWIVLALLCAMEKVENAWYLPGDITPVIERISKTLESSVQCFVKPVSTML